MTDNGESEVLAKMAQKAFASSSNYENVRANYSFEAVEFFCANLAWTVTTMTKPQRTKQIALLLSWRSVVARENLLASC